MKYTFKESLTTPNTVTMLSAKYKIARFAKWCTIVSGIYLYVLKLLENIDDLAFQTCSKNLVIKTNLLFANTSAQLLVTNQIWILRVAQTIHVANDRDTFWQIIVLFVSKHTGASAAVTTQF